MKETTEDFKNIISGEITVNNKRLMTFGIFALIFGIAGTFMSTVMTVTSIIFLGIFVIITGFIFLLEAFSAPKWKGKLFNLLISILYIILGGIILIDPTASAISFTLLIAWFLILIGIMRIIIAFQVKDGLKVWGLIFFSGLLSVMLGVMIYQQWPWSGLWVIGFLVSIELAIQGMSAIFLSREIQKIQKEKD